MKFINFLPLSLVVHQWLHLFLFLGVNQLLQRQEGFLLVKQPVYPNCLLFVSKVLWVKVLGCTTLMTFFFQTWFRRRVTYKTRIQTVFFTVLFTDRLWRQTPRWLSAYLSCDFLESDLPVLWENPDGGAQLRLRSFSQLFCCPNCSV